MMQSPLLLTISCASLLLTSSCKHQEPRLFSEEADPVFAGAERRVIKPYGLKWVAYYFENESVESLALKMSQSQFFVRDGWGAFKTRIPGKHMSTSKRGRIRLPDGALLLITVTAGKDFSEQSGPAGDEGATVTLLPSSSEQY